MLNYLTPIALTLLAWWLCTGIVLLLNKLPTTTQKWSLTGATLLMLFCLVHLQEVANEPSKSAAILAFLQALCIWAWLEMTYLMGWLTGTSKAPCPPQTLGFKRFKLALMTSIHHELAVILIGVVIIATTWNSVNEICVLTYLTLWLMRWSAKLNLFLGVANLNTEWFPDKMRYLTTYMRHRRMNPFFPFSMLFALVVTAHWAYTAANATTMHELTGYTLIASLLTLAMLEHCFLVVRVGDSALWSWALKAATRYSESPLKVKKT
jgi:putative photosynthetic complex assembly protein 2